MRKALALLFVMLCIGCDDTISDHNAIGYSINVHSHIQFLGIGYDCNGYVKWDEFGDRLGIAVICDDGTIIRSPTNFVITKLPTVKTCNE